MKRIPGVRYIVAPYEADAQLGFLARNGHVDAVITEDSDVLLFGCTRVLFKLERDGTGQEVNLKDVFSRRYRAKGSEEYQGDGRMNFLLPFLECYPVAFITRGAPSCGLLQCVLRD